VSTMAATLGEERLDSLETRLASAEAKRQRQLNQEQDKQISGLQTRLGSLRDIIVKLKNSYTQQTDVAKQLLNQVAAKNGIAGVGAVAGSGTSAPALRKGPIPNPASKEAQKLADETMAAHPSSFDQQIRALLEQVRNEARQIYSQQAQQQSKVAPSRLPVKRTRKSRKGRKNRKNRKNRKVANANQPAPKPANANANAKPASQPAANAAKPGAAPKPASKAAGKNSNVAKQQKSKNSKKGKSKKPKDKRKKKHRFKKATFKPLYHKAGNEPGEDLMAADDQTTRLNDIMTNYPVRPALQMQDAKTVAYKQSLPLVLGD